jgi:hypothetical protein
MKWIEIAEAGLSVTQRRNSCNPATAKASNRADLVTQLAFGRKLTRFVAPEPSYNYSF